MKNIGRVWPWLTGNLIVFIDWSLVTHDLQNDSTNFTSGVKLVVTGKQICK